MGEDPSEQAKALRQVPTFAVYTDQQLLPYLKLTKKSWQCDLSLLKLHLLPSLGKKPLNAISRADVLALQTGKLDAGLAPGTVYRIMVLLRYAMRLAGEWEVPGLTTNPCTKVPLPKVNNARQTFLSAKQAEDLLAAVRASSNPHLEAIVGFLLLTGARKREALDARWEHIQWEQRRWYIPVTKTGKPRHVPLSDSAVSLLRRQEAKIGRSPWLFPNPTTGIPYKNLHTIWDKARKEAGLNDVRMHDLRHSFASFLINDGRSLYEVQQLLGHSNSTMTQRYAHLADATLLEATNSVSAAVGAFIKQA